VSAVLPEGTVTLLFTDVEGSTDLRTREGDDAAQEVLRTHEELLREQIERHGGREVVFMGDGFMVAFGSTRRALTCAVEIQRACDRHNRDHPRHPIRVRAGLNAGEVHQERGTLYGTAVNAAARIMGHADGGEIYVSQLVKDLTAGIRDFAFEDRGLRDLKGFPEPWRLYEVRWHEEPVEPDEATAAPVPSTPLAQTAIEGAVPRPEFELVGREAERDLVTRELEEAARGRVRIVSLEGEAGIGKTRLMEDAAQRAAERGFGVLLAGGDEELRGPFLLLRTLLSSTSMEALSDTCRCRDALDRARRVLAGGAVGSEEGLTPSEQMLQVYDVATMAIRGIAADRPVALLLDDLQWADEDSLKLVRYLVRTSAGLPIFLLLSIRWEVEPTQTSASTLVADLERMGVAKRARLERLSRSESAELLAQVLGAPVGAEASQVLHQRGEGVPFFMVEFARAYREARLLQQVRGRWEIGKDPRQTVPASVQVLLERRLAGLPEETRAILADAAVVGRRVRLDDLAEVRRRAGDQEATPIVLEERLAPALAHSLLAELSEGDYDYAFTHDQIRSVLLESLSKARRRAIHGALQEIVAARAGVDLDADGDGVPAAVLSIIANHAIAAGDAERGIRFSIAAARAALAAHAPEEAVRLVDAARPVAASPQQRAELLRIRDDALTVLGRGEERIPILAELAALVEALGDPGVEIEVTLRRASAARLVEEWDQAADLARRAEEAAAERGDDVTRLHAELELGQALLQSPLGEGYSPDPNQDLDAAEEAYGRAADLARSLGQDRVLAQVLRELALVEAGRAVVRINEVLRGGGGPAEVFMDPAVREHLERAKELLGQAIELCERTGDRRCEMSSLIALAYAHTLDDTQYGHAGRIEQIRRLRQRFSRMTSESERATGELHMLYSTLIYCLAHGYPDLGLARGAECHELARARGESLFEFLSAGGIAEIHLELNEVREAEAWIGRAEEAMLGSSRPLPQRQLELWRGLLRAAEGDGSAMVEHLRAAARIASGAGSPAGRCQALAILAVKAALLGADRGDEGLLRDAEEAAEEALRVADALPGSAMWRAKALAARAQGALHRGDQDEADALARSALVAEDEARHLLKPVDLDLWLVVARALEGREDPQAVGFRVERALMLALRLMSIVDESARQRFQGSERASELIERLGGLPDLEEMFGLEMPSPERLFSGRELELLRRLVAGESVPEMAGALDAGAEEIEAELAGLLSKMGTSGAGRAAELAVREGIA
jgi:class 3 adenylate cyclase